MENQHLSFSLQLIWCCPIFMTLFQTYDPLWVLFYCHSISWSIQPQTHVKEKRDWTTGYWIHIAPLHLCDPQSSRLSPIWSKLQTLSPFRQAVCKGNGLGAIHDRGFYNCALTGYCIVLIDIVALAIPEFSISLKMYYNYMYKSFHNSPKLHSMLYIF